MHAKRFRGEQEVNVRIKRAESALGLLEASLRDPVVCAVEMARIILFLCAVATATALAPRDGSDGTLAERLERLERGLWPVVQNLPQHPPSVLTTPPQPWFITSPGTPC